MPKIYCLWDFGFGFLGFGISGVEPFQRYFGNSIANYRYLGQDAIILNNLNFCKVWSLKKLGICIIKKWRLCASLKAAVSQRHVGVEKRCNNWFRLERCVTNAPFVGQINTTAPARWLVGILWFPFVHSAIKVSRSSCELKRNVFMLVTESGEMRSAFYRDRSLMVPFHDHQSRSEDGSSL